MYKVLTRWICLLSLLGVTTVIAQDEYERVVAEKLKSGIENAEILDLTGGTGPFIGIYQASTRQPGNAVLLLHSMGAHPDWPQVVSPLRTGLPLRGWASLSIQLPVFSPAKPFAGYGQTIDEGRTRITRGIEQLQQRGHTNVVLIGYGFGATVASSYLANTRAQKTTALIVISPQAQPFLKPKIDLLELLRKIEIPVLDIYGSRDFDAIIAQADDRRLAGKVRGNRNYYQIRLEGADYYYSGMEPVLLQRITTWLDKRVTGGGISQKPPPYTDGTYY